MENLHAEAVNRWTNDIRNIEIEPAQRLMLAVLQDAILTLIDPPLSKAPANYRLIQETESWLRSNDQVHPFAFLSVCDALSLDPQYLRCAIVQWRGAKVN